MQTPKRAERLNGVTERRSVGLTDFETRASGDTLQFNGYASLFDTGYEMCGGPDNGGWVEFVDARAFDRTLSAKPDVVLNINHGKGGTGLPLARTTSGTLDLRADSKGLLSAASLDLRDPDVQALQVKIERGDVNQMSFAFRTIRQEWNNAEDERFLKELSLDHGDVSIVTSGAQPKTNVSIRGLNEALDVLMNLDFEEALAEVRDAGGDLADVEAAKEVLERLLAKPTDQEVRKALSLAQARRLALLDQ